MKKAYKELAKLHHPDRETGNLERFQVGPDEFPFVYGMMSESIHGSWNQSMDWCLSRNADGTFSTYALFVGVDARAILPLVRYATPPYALCSPWKKSVRWVPLFRRLGDERLSRQAPSVSI